MAHGVGTNASASDGVSNTSPTRLRRNTSEPLPGLPVNKQVPLAVKLAQNVAAWRAERDVPTLREGNVVKATRHFLAGAAHVDRGQWGKVQHVAEDGTAKILLDGSGFIARVRPKDFAHLEVQPITHEVELINPSGSPTESSSVVW